MKTRSLYIVLSRTRTALGVIIQNVLDNEYNHCSIALDEDPNTFYSFGRIRANNFLIAGFVLENKDFGFFKVFDSSRICILKLDVTQEQYDRCKAMIERFIHHKDIYGFNIVGLALAKLSIPYGGNTRYFCSQFVSEVLRYGEVYAFSKDSRLVTPQDMFKIPDTKIVYAGQIKDYTPTIEMEIPLAI